MADDNQHKDEQDHWVIIAHTTDRMEAEVIAGLLRSENIPVFISQPGAGQAMGITVGILGIIDIMVPSKHEELALSLLDEPQPYDASLED